MDTRQKYAEKFAEKSGAYLPPNRTVTETVVAGLARHIEEWGSRCVRATSIRTNKMRPNSAAGICAGDEMQIYKYHHCLLFSNEEGRPITVYLPEDREGRQLYGLDKDPHLDKGRA